MNLKTCDFSNGSTESRPTSLEPLTSGHPTPKSILFNPRPVVAILSAMKRLLVLIAVTAALFAAGSGCKSDPGSREYIPGKGWRPV